MIIQLILLLIASVPLHADIFSTLNEFNERNRAEAYAAFQYFLGQQAGDAGKMSRSPRSKIPNLDEMHGLPQGIQRLRSQFKQNDHPDAQGSIPHSFIFFGPPGTGKTMAAQSLADELGFETECVLGSQFFNQYIGESQRSVEKLFTRLRERNKKIMLIVENIDALLGQKVAKEHPEYRGAADRFMAELANPQNENIYVVGTAKNMNDISDAYKNNGSIEQDVIEFRLPNEQERAAIIRAYLQRKQCNASEELIRSLVKLSHNMSGSDIANIVRKMSAADIAAPDQSLMRLFQQRRQEKNEEAKRAAAQHESFFVEIKEPRTSFNDFGGRIPDEITNLLRKFTSPETCIVIAGGGSESPGLLLYGPHGTGKTLLAEAFAGQARAKFAYIPASSITDGIVGGGARRIESIFRQVRQYVEANPDEKVVVFIDELDAIGCKRQQNEAEFGNTLNALKIALGDIASNKSILVIAATNHEEMLDPALIRTGRFNTKVPIPLPTVASRKQILQHYIQRVPHTIPAEELPAYLDRLADQTEGFNCADLRAIIFDKACSFANIANVRVLAQAHIDQGLAEVKKMHLQRLKKDVAYRMELDPTLQLNQILGLPKEVNDYLADLRAYILMPNQAPRGLLLYGPPGTGKTTVAKCVAQESGFDCAYLVASQLFNLPEGAEGIIKLFAGLRSTNRPTVLVVDEIDAIGSKKVIEADPGAASIATSFWNELSSPLNNKIFVVATTNKRDLLEEALVRTGRFEQKVLLDLPDKRLRGEIIDHYLRQLGMEIAADQLAELVKLSRNFSGQDLKTFIMRARRECARGEERTAMMANLRAIIKKEGDERREKLQREMKERGMPFEIRDPKISMKDVAGSIDADVQTILQHFKTGTNSFGRKPAQGLLLYGPPGTGKSMLAEAFAGEANAKFISISAGGFANKYIGVGPQAIKDLFACAKSFVEDDGHKVVIFIDEFDAVAVQRRDNDSGEERRMVAELLSGLSAFENMSDKVFVIAATNCQKDLEEAVIRNGRFGTKKEIKLPTLNNRAAILKYYLDPFITRHELYPSDATLEFLTSNISLLYRTLQDTDGFAAGDLRRLVERAIDLAIRENSTKIKSDHLAVAVKEVRNDIVMQKDRNKTMQEKQFDEMQKQNRIHNFMALGQAAGGNLPIYGGIGGAVGFATATCVNGLETMSSRQGMRWLF